MRRTGGGLAPALPAVAAVGLLAALLSISGLSGLSGLPGLSGPSGGAPSAGASTQAVSTLDRALQQFVRRPSGPPGVIVVVQRGGALAVYRAGTAVLRRQVPITTTDRLRLASVAKAFSGAVALSLVTEGTLTLHDTVGQWLPGQPAAWAHITLAELLQHTSGLPDFSQSKAFGQALVKSPGTAPPPTSLLSYVATTPLLFPPGTQYRYSNTDNIVVALMTEAATHQPYTAELQTHVYGPMGLRATSLPAGSAVPAPYVPGWADLPKPGEDVTSAYAAGWSWASGGIVSTPADANRFVRAYVGGRTTNAATRFTQFQFRPGDSEPPGPGQNSVGLALFRYRTSCGTVYGHTGNTAGYTQFISASSDGTRSVVVSVNSQITPKSNPSGFTALRRIYALAVCAALRPR